MKRLILGCALAVLGMTAADLPAYQYDNGCCAEPTYNGFYVGADVGVLSHVARRNDLDGFLTDNSSWTTLNTGFAGGGQIGYDWQCGCRVLGLVADWNGTTVDAFLREEPNDDVDDNYIKNQMHWYSSIRFRAGVDVCDNLFYVTGGPVVANFVTTWNDDDDRFRIDKTQWGWMAGVGAEFLICGNFTAGTDLYFMHFADREHTGTTDTPATFAFRHNDSLWGLRFSVNYRFGNFCSR